MEFYMGGKATEKYQTKRMAQEIYEKIVNHFNSYKEEGERFAVPFSYKDKDTHGDVDLLTTMSLNGLLEKIKEDKDIEIHQDYLASIEGREISEHINHIPIRIKNNNIETDWFQLDILRAEHEDFDCTFRYYCYNDLGNMIGRIAYGLGLDFGQRGLTYKFPKDHVFRKELGKEGDLIITKDYFKALDFLGLKGLNENNFNDYFKNKEDIFNFIYKCENMKPYAFLNVLKRSKSKIRDRKRGTLNEFLEFLVKKGDLTKEEVEAEDVEIFKNNKTVQSMMEEKAVEIVNSFKPDIPYTQQIKKMSFLLFKKNVEKSYEKIFSIESFKDKLSKEDYKFIKEAKENLKEKYSKNKLDLISLVNENIGVKEFIGEELFSQIQYIKTHDSNVLAKETIVEFLERIGKCKESEKLKDYIKRVGKVKEEKLEDYMKKVGNTGKVKRLFPKNN